jgi:hypothetical protein
MMMVSPMRNATRLSVTAVSRATRESTRRTRVGFAV